MVKIPLDMGNGKYARNMQELLDNFSTEKIVEHYKSGKLLKWLKERYYDDELNKIAKIEKNGEKHLAKDLCKAFGVPFDEDVKIDSISRRLEKLDILRKYTDDEEVIKNVDSIALNQNDLDELIEAGCRKIYLYSESSTFRIKITYENVEYIGLTDVTVQIPSKKIVPFAKKRITFRKIQFDEAYKKVVEEYSVENKIIIDSYCGILYINDSKKLEAVLFDKRKTHNLLLCRLFNEGMSSIASIYYNEYDTTCCALDDEGNAYVYCNGDSKITKISRLTDAVKICICGYKKFCAIDRIGRLYRFDAFHYTAEMIEKLPQMKYLTGQDNLVLAVDENGKVHVISTPDYGTSLVNIPEDLPKIRQIEIGVETVYALSEKGKLHTWGRYSRFIKPDGLPEIASIGAAYSRGCLLLDKNGSIIPCGIRGLSEEFEQKIKDLPKIKTVLDVVAGDLWTLSEDGYLYRNNGVFTFTDSDGKSKHIKI